MVKLYCINCDKVQEVTMQSHNGAYKCDVCGALHVVIDCETKAI